MIGCDDKGDARIERGAKQQKARGLGCVIDRERPRQQIVDGS